jgi:hypothetical protein
LIIALGVLVLEAAFLVTALAALVVSGQDQFVAAGLVVLVLLAIRTGLKWFGYLKCELAADAVQAAAWMTMARYATLVRAVGFAGMLTPWLIGVPPNESGSASAVAAVGQVAWMLGTVAEFAVLLTWHRLLNELGGPAIARRVTVYTATFAFAILTVAAGVCLATLLTAAARGRAGPPATPQGVSDVPPEGWYALTGVVALMTAFAVVLVWQYYRILSTTRSELSRT